MTDVAGRLDLGLEQPLPSAPPDVWRFTENYLVAAYDPAADISIWAHLGTWPDDFGLWEDQLLVGLPGDQDLLWAYGYRRTPLGERPGGASLALTCLEPFRRWRATYDGVVVRTPYDEARTGLVRDGEKDLLAFDLELECVAPAWDPTASRHDAADAMASETWATAHYQQLIRATGEVRLGDRVVQFDGHGLRDHSRGQRGHAAAHFGGHHLISAHFPSGRSFGAMRMWAPDGTVGLDAAYVVIDGTVHRAEVVEPPSRLHSTLPGAGEALALVLRSPVGEHLLRGETRSTTLATASERLGMHVGADAASGRVVFAQGFARWTWDGEVAFGLTERSDRLA
jgi:hypothetical protein